MSVELQNKVYDSIDVARYLLALANEKKKILNVTKVQKLLFIAYGYFLSKYGVRIIDETPKAWPFGPVFPETQKKVDYTTIYGVNSPVFDELKRDQDVTEILNTIIDNYSNFSASQLSDWSHMEGSPWEKTTKESGFNWNEEINEEYIKGYFCDITL